jgi:hypothetical protein
MNGKFNAKMWIVGLMLVGAQAVSAMEAVKVAENKEGKVEVPAPKPADKTPEKTKNPVIAPAAPAPEKGQETGKPGEEPKQGENSGPKDGKIEAQQDAKQEPTAKDAGIIASVMATIQAYCTNTKTLASNMVEFGNKNRMFTGLTFGVPAALALAYKFAPNSVKRHWLYKKFKDEVPGFVKGALVTAVPMAIWGWYFMHRGDIVAAPAPTAATA